MYKKDLKTKYYIIKDGEVMGRVWGLETAQKVCFIRKAAFACIYEHLVQLDDEWFYALYQRHVSEQLPEFPMVIEEMARDLFAALEAQKFPYIMKPSCKDLIREMYNVHSHWHKDDIAATCSGANWNSIRVAFSQLRREGYNIKYHQDGLYVRQ